MARRILVIGVSGGLHYNEILSGVLMGYFSARGMGEMTYVGQKRSMPDFFSQLAAKRKAMRITLADFPWETLPEYDVIITLGQTGSYEITIDDKGPRRFAFPPSPDNMSDAQVRAVTEFVRKRLACFFFVQHRSFHPCFWLRNSPSIRRSVSRCNAALRICR